MVNIYNCKCLSLILIILCLLNKSCCCMSMNKSNKKKQNYDCSKNKFTKSNYIINTVINSNQDPEFYHVELSRQIELSEPSEPNNKINNMFYFYGHLTIPIICFIFIRRI